MDQQSHTHTARLLLVDDSRDNLDLLQALLAGQGYQIYTADNGKEGLALTQQINPDLVLLDIMMPDMDGFEVCRLLKEDKNTHSIPVMFLTAHDEVKVMLKGLRLGAVDYINHPLNKEILLARVRTHIENGKLTRRLQDAVAEKTLKLNKVTENLKKLAYQIGMAEERQRRAIAVGLHDGPIQELGWIYMQMDTLKNVNEPETTAEICNKTMGHLDKIIHNLRYMIFDLSPPVLYELGFNAALEWLINDFLDRYDFTFSLSSSGDDQRIDIELAIVLFQSTRELMNNVIKHANASEGWVNCDVNSEKVIIEVIDDGTGFTRENLEQEDNPYSGFGLFGIRQKLEQHGGQLNRLEQKQGAGMQIVAPLTTPDLSG